MEQARGQMRVAPSVALALAAEHAQRFPHGQLASERALIQIEALHRLGRDAQARSLAHGLLVGAGAGLYAERVQQLLGENGAPLKFFVKASERSRDTRLRGHLQAKGVATEGDMRLALLSVLFPLVLGCAGEKHGGG